MNDLNKRKHDVISSGLVSYVFDEESLEQKQDYVSKHQANMLVMGDDWNNAFDFCNCACLYLPRTPDISTTMLNNS